MSTRLRQERGVASALLSLYAFLLFAMLFTSYTAYHRLVAIPKAKHAPPGPPSTLAQPPPGWTVAGPSVFAEVVKLGAPLGRYLEPTAGLLAVVAATVLGGLVRAGFARERRRM